MRRISKRVSALALAGVMMLGSLVSVSAAKDIVDQDGIGYLSMSGSRINTCASTRVSSTTPATGTVIQVKLVTKDSKNVQVTTSNTTTTRGFVTVFDTAPSGRTFKWAKGYHTHIYRGVVIDSVDTVVK